VTSCLGPGLCLPPDHAGIFDVAVLAARVAVLPLLTITATSRLATGGGCTQEADHRDCWLPRACHKRPPGRRAAEKGDELATAQMAQPRVPPPV
jgi:hypothetical protein